MKKILFIVIILLLFPITCSAAINLVGTTDKNKLNIVEKFSPFYAGNINIEIVNKFPQDYYQISSTIFYTDKTKKTIEREWNQYGYVRNISFEFVLNSQLCRYYFPSYNVWQCDRFSKEMITYVNGL